MIDSKLVLEYTRQLNVLYVEDDPIVSQQTTMLLENFFATLDSATNGEEGLNAYMQFHQRNGTNYDLVITDIKMPKMDGILMSKAIMERNPQQTIVVISAYNDAQYLFELINLGISNFINKPIDPSHLIKVLFKTSQAIADHKAVEAYYTQIEALNDELLAKNEELETNNKKLAQSLRVFETKAKNLNRNKVKCNDAQQPHKKSDEERELGILIGNDLPELNELYEEMDATVMQMMLSESCDKMGELADLIDRYGKLLSGYYSFFTISAAFKELVQTMQQTPLPDGHDERLNILLMLESFVFTLKRWMDEVAHKNVTVNFFDASLISDTKTIINLWSGCQGSEEVSDEDIFF